MSLLASYPSKIATVLKGHQSAIQVVRFNSDGNYCLSGSTDKTIRLWNPFTNRLIKTYVGHGWDVLDLCVSTDNARIGSCGGDRMIFLWDVATGRVIRKFRGHEHRVNCIRFNEDCSVLITGSYDKTVKIWDVRANLFEAIQVLEDAKDSISSLIVNPTEIISGSIDGRIRTYDIRLGQLTTDTLGQPIASINLSHDGNCILASCLDNAVRLIDKREGELLNTYTGHCNSEYKIDSIFSNDDAFIFSGSEDGMVYVWDLLEAKIVSKLSAHNKPCVTLAYHPSQNSLLSGSADASIKLWQ